MTPWTDAAREQLEAYFVRVTPALREGGADPAEVIEDLRQTLAREAQAEGLTVMTESDVKRLLKRIGAPEPAADSTPAAPSPTSAQAADPVACKPASGRGKRPGVWLLLAGVVLPLVAFLVEWATGMCAAAFFDPLPTLGHIVLVAAVPVINLACWLATRQEPPKTLTWLVWANGVAMGVAGFCAVQFLPLLLPGLLAVVVFGWGLLPWAPMLSLVAAVVLRWHLRRAFSNAGSGVWPRTWPAALVAVVALVGIEASLWTTRVALVRAAAAEPETQRSGIALLRSFGNHETLLRACYGRTRRAAEMDLVGLVLTGQKNVPPSRAREIYYRVYGRPFNSVPPPEIRSARGQLIGFEDWTWDEDQGGEQVGGRLRGLYLQGSRLDATVEADAALAYFEWALEFRNDATRAQEARAQVLLPPGGVVSRLTLWVNGEEREAAFAGRSRVRQAYQAVAIQQRRDPVLVTTAGPDRVLVQCFPVPAQGTMKVRLGITAPLTLREPGEALLAWPQIIERNFSMPEAFRHALWVDSTDALDLSCGALKRDAAGNGARISLHGELTDPQLAGAAAVTSVKRMDRPSKVWAPDPRSEPPQFVEQSWSKLERKPLSGLCLVLDGSVSMRDAARAVASVLETLPEDTAVQAFVARDVVETFSSGGQPPRREDPRAFARKIRAVRFAGGQDNAAALAEAWDVAANQPGTVVVWVHGPQPVLVGSADTLRQRLERAAAGPAVFSFQVTPGPNRLLEQLDGLPRLNSVPRFRTVEQDLGAFLLGLVQPPAELRATRVAAPERPSPTELNAGKAASFHLVRLWAHDRIRSGQLSGDEAVRWATRYQLVSPISGAVVLETEEQYRQFGLQAAAKETTPSMAKPGLEVAALQPVQDIQVVPEPGTVCLLVLGAACLGAHRARRRRRG